MNTITDKQRVMMLLDVKNIIEHHNDVTDEDKDQLKLFNLHMYNTIKGIKHNSKKLSSEQLIFYCSSLNEQLDELLILLNTNNK